MINVNFNRFASKGMGKNAVFFNACGRLNALPSLA